MTTKYNILQREARLIKINHNVILHGSPCKVIAVSGIKTGKFGSKKISISANNLINNKVVQWIGYEDVVIHIFTPIRMNYQVINVENDVVDVVEYLDANENIQTIKVTSENILEELRSKIYDEGIPMQIEITYMPIMKNENKDDIEDYYSIRVLAMSN